MTSTLDILNEALTRAININADIRHIRRELAERMDLDPFGSVPEHLWRQIVALEERSSRAVDDIAAMVEALPEHFRVNPLSGAVEERPF